MIQEALQIGTHGDGVLGLIHVVEQSALGQPKNRRAGTGRQGEQRPTAVAAEHDDLSSVAQAVRMARILPAGSGR